MWNIFSICTFHTITCISNWILVVDNWSIHTNVGSLCEKYTPYQIQLHLLLPLLSSICMNGFDFFFIFTHTRYTRYMTTLIVQFSLESYDIYCIGSIIRLLHEANFLATLHPIQPDIDIEQWENFPNIILCFCIFWMRLCVSRGVIHGAHWHCTVKSYFNKMTVCIALWCDNWRVCQVNLVSFIKIDRRFQSIVEKCSFGNGKFLTIFIHH